MSADEYTPSEEAIERAARAAYEWRGEDYRWATADEPTRDYWRERMRAALVAAGPPDR